MAAAGRAQIEGLATDIVIPMLAPYGFQFAPQPPGTFEDPSPSAVFQILPGDSCAQFPSFASDSELNVSEVDLVFEWHPDAAVAVAGLLLGHGRAEFGREATADQ